MEGAMRKRRRSSREMEDVVGALSIGALRARDRVGLPTDDASCCSEHLEVGQ